MEFRSPKDSAAHRELIAAADRASLNSMHLRRLLWLINAHPNLVGHCQVFDHIKLHLDSPVFSDQNLKWAVGWTSDIPEWRLLCSWVVANRRKLAQLAGLREFDLSQPGKHPIVSRGVGRHGVVAALWNKHESSIVHSKSSAIDLKASAHFLELQAHLLASYMNCRFIMSDLAFYEEYQFDEERPIAPMSTQSISVALRMFSLRKFSHFLANIPSIPSTPEFAIAIRDFRPPPDKSERGNSTSSSATDSVEPYLHSVRRYFIRFSDMQGPWRPNQSKRKRGGGSGGHARVHGFINLPGPEGVFFEDADPQSNDPDVPIPMGQRVFVLAERPSEAAEIKAAPHFVETSGLAPGELLEEIFPLYSPQEMKGQVLKGHFQRLAAEARAQVFPFDFSQLTPSEIAAVDRRANDWIAASVCHAQFDVVNLKLVAGLIVRTMLCFGQSVHQAWSMQVVWITPATAFDELTNFEQIRLVVQADSPGDWKSACVQGFRLPGIGPDYKSDMPVGLEEVDREFTSSFLLPDLLGAGKQLAQYLQVTGRKDLHGFGIDLNAAQQAVTALLESLEEPRITANKLTGAMASIITAQTGDQTLAWIVTGDQRKGNQTRMFYMRYTTQQLNDAYVRGARRMARMVGAAPPLPVSTQLARISVPSVGARFVISIEEVRELVEQLVTHLTKPLPKVPSQGFFQQYHRRYVMYTHLFQSLETSVRAITGPNDLFRMWKTSLRDYGPVVAPLSDKDTRYSDRSRMVQIRPPLDLQFEHYQKHIEHLHLHIKSAFASIKSRQERQPFFLIDDRYQFKDLTPTDFAEFLNEYTSCPVPANFHRGFLKTELILRKIPPEIVDAHFGHAGFGESSHSWTSSFDFGLHVPRIAAAIQDIHDAIGLRPIVSQIGFIRLRGERQ